MWLGAILISSSLDRPWRERFFAFRLPLVWPRVPTGQEHAKNAAAARRSFDFLPAVFGRGTAGRGGLILIGKGNFVAAHNDVIQPERLKPLTSVTGRHVCVHHSCPGVAHPSLTSNNSSSTLQRWWPWSVGPLGSATRPCCCHGAAAHGALARLE
jgi:hypothetical protein